MKLCRWLEAGSQVHSARFLLLQRALRRQRQETVAARQPVSPLPFPNPAPTDSTCPRVFRVRPWQKRLPAQRGIASAANPVRVPDGPRATHSEGSHWFLPRVACRSHATTVSVDRRFPCSFFSLWLSVDLVLFGFGSCRIAVLFGFSRVRAEADDPEVPTSPCRRVGFRTTPDTWRR